MDIGHVPFEAVRPTVSFVAEITLNSDRNFPFTFRFFVNDSIFSMSSMKSTMMARLVRGLDTARAAGVEVKMSAVREDVCLALHRQGGGISPSTSSTKFSSSTSTAL